MRAAKSMGIGSERIRVILVEPKYQVNLGYEARVLKNFGINKVWIVRPRCSVTGREAIKYSKHAKDVLENAMVLNNIRDAIRGSDMVIGTTGVWHKTEGAYMNFYPPDQLARIAKDKPQISILIGRDDIGLTKEELNLCDATVFIPTNPKYPILNISHALAIVLYELTKLELWESQGLERWRATGRERRAIGALFAKAANSRKEIRDKRAVIAAFSHIIARADSTKKELGAIAAVLAPSRESRIKGKSIIKK